MFALKFATLLAVATAAFALPSPGGSSSSNSCSTGTLSCCNTNQTVSGDSTGTLSGIISILAELGIPIDVSCAPIDILALGKNSCSAQTSCCSNVTSSGIGLNCDPINLNL